MAREVWRKVAIKRWSDKYEVSSFGRVRSVDRWIRPEGVEPYYLRGRVLRLVTVTGGYVQVSLGGQLQCLVHILVAKAFIPNPKRKPVVNHKDRNRRNNRISNLEWVTYKENNAHWRSSKLTKHQRGC